MFLDRIESLKSRLENGAQQNVLLCAADQQMVRTKALDGAHHPLKPMQQSDCWWVLTAVGKSEFGLYGVVGGMTMIELLASGMRQMRGGIIAVMPEDECE